MSSASFEVTAVYVQGFCKALKEVGLFDAVAAKLSPATKAVLENPFISKTHPLSLFRELADTTYEVGGAERYEHHAYVMTREALGKILLPMFKVALALTGRTPATLMARVPDSVGQALRGVTATWEPKSPRNGTLNVVYPIEVPPSAEYAWRGTLRFLFTLLENTPTRIDRFTRDETGTRLGIDVSW